MNAKVEKLKLLLREGAVRFSYKKKDGTVRNANGSLQASLLPATSKTVKFDVYGIEWKTPSDALPTKMAVSMPESKYVALSKDTTGPDATGLDDEIAASISEQAGAEPAKFSYDKRDQIQKKLPAGTVFYYDLDKSGFRSFNESQFIEIL